VRGPLRHGLRNPLEDTLRIFQNFVVPEPQDIKSPALQEACPNFVALHVDRVLPAIDLDHEATRMADEIDDVSSNGFLATKLESRELAGPKQSPDHLLGIGHLAAKAAR
jgi:hypothetical protein